jgi:hypothetical protein
MKKLLNLLLVALALCCVACNAIFGDDVVNRPGGNGGGPSTPTTTFAINVTNITSSGAVVTVAASTNETYFFDIIEKSTYEQYSSAALFANDIVAQLKSVCAEENSSLSDYLSSGTDSYEYKLLSDVEYYAYAFGLTSNGEVTTDVTLKSFKTLKSESAVPSTNILTLNVSQITANGATVSVEPSNNDTYYFDVVEKSVIDSYGGALDFALEYIVMVKNSCEEMGATLADALSSGPDSYSFDGYLSPNTEYYAFAFGATPDCSITTSVVTLPFTTLSAGSGSDKVLNSFAYGYYTNYGDYYGSGAANWYIDLYSEQSTDMLVLEVQTPLNATTFTGNYPLASTCASGTAVTGFIDAEGYITGSFWCQLNEDYDIIDYALCSSGNVSIGKSGANYTISVDAKDENGNSIISEFEGSLEEYVEESAATLSFKKQAARRFRFVPKQKSVNVSAPLQLSPKRVVAPKGISIKRDFLR